MAVKKSRTGKKKRPEYGPQGTKTNAVLQPTEKEIQQYKAGRRANFASIGLLLIAMILLVLAPNTLDGQASNAVLVIIAYCCTIAAGGVMIYTTRFLVPDRVKMTRIMGGVMIVIGAAGIFFTVYSLMNPVVA